MAPLENSKMTFRKFLAAKLMTVSDVAAHGVSTRLVFHALNDNISFKGAKKIAGICNYDVNKLFPKSIIRWQKRMRKKRIPRAASNTYAINLSPSKKNM
jgi:5-formyltetrahydrofolate cyclo-ligase